MAEPSSLIIRVPASTSNLGPGFDCLGMALDLENTFTVVLSPRERNRLNGRGTCDGMRIAGNPFFRLFRRVYEVLGHPKAPAVHVTIDGRVPMGVGLGSSATGCVAATLAANRFLGSPLSSGELLAIMARDEGHPDNVAPALLGGLTAAVLEGSTVTAHVYEPCSTWWLAFLVPDYQYPTKQARKALPANVALKDACANLARLPLLVDALVQGDAASLAMLMQDRIHEPVRKNMIKRSAALRRAAMEAGASATFISGSGPAIGAFCEHKSGARRALDAMLDLVHTARFTATGFILSPEVRGARIVDGK